MNFRKLQWPLGVLGACIIYWLIDSVWSYLSFEINLKALIFSEPRTLADTLLLRTPPYQVVSRLTLTILIIVGGWLLYKYVSTIKSSGQKLRASEERFRSFSEQSLVGIYLVKDGFFTYVNPKFAEISGYSVEECLNNLHFTKVVHPEDLALVKEQLRRRTGGERQSIRYEFRGVRKNGQVVHLEVYGSSIIHQGEMLATGTMLDITDRKKAEHALRQSEERNRQILHTAMDGFCRMDSTGKLLEVNRAYCNITGYEQHELLTMNIAELDADDTQRDVTQKIQLVKEKGSARFEKRHRRKDGSLITVEISVQYRQAGQEGECVSFVRDITEQRRAEKEKARLEASLRHAQKLQAVGTLAGGVAHEFNNLLAAIMGYSEMIINSDGGREDLAAHAAQIFKASERGRDLVQNILSFTHKAELRAKTLNLNDEIRNSKDMLAQLLPRTVTIETKLTADQDSVNMDASHLSQILMNLTTNACHAMPDGGKLIIKTEKISVEGAVCFACGETFSGDYMLLSVSDTGQGINAETIQRIYEPFFSTKEIGSGTGLGLSVVQGLVKSHGGHIICESEEGAGTTFKIFLPLTHAEQAALAVKDAAQWEVAGGTETILLVDDEESLRNIAQQYLSEIGYQVRQADSGEMALEIYRRAPGEIDLVILDLGMAGMGGHKCLKEILAINPRAKVLIASGYTTDSQEQQALAAGAAAFVGKPFKMAQLLGIVRNLLDMS